MRKLNFVEFFSAIHGQRPFPWQMRLVKDLIAGKPWPSLIDLSTGCGKTACIDIAVFHLAWCAAAGRPYEAARRIVLVVDRRIIVNAAYERAERIQNALKKPQNPSVAAVAAALKRLGGEEPLHCQKLRGGMARERGFALNPAQPMVITSTVDQVGSRLLFRGYGLGPYMQPLHAGLLGHDTLILADEAHLSQPFLETVSAIRREQMRAREQLTPIQPVRLVSLSATAVTEGKRFKLDKPDLADPFIRKVRTTKKFARLVRTSGAYAERLTTLLQETRKVYAEIGGTAPTIAVMVNRVKTARDLFDKLRSGPERGIQIELITGRGRPLDREVLEKRLVGRTDAGRERLPEDKGLIVVATQSLEVGADLDFQGLITECAAIDSLRQRFGRLDRRGEFGRARAVIVGCDKTEDDPIYGTAASKTWKWLNKLAKRVDGCRVVDFSSAAIEKALKSTDAARLMPLIQKPRETLQLTPTHVDLLCQTSPRPLYDPDISAMLHGFGSGEPDVQVIWREHIPVTGRDRDWTLAPDQGELTKPILTLIPPSSLEALSLPVQHVRGWLCGRPDSADLSDLEGASASSAEIRSTPGISGRLVWRRVREERDMGAAKARNDWEVVLASKVQAGDTIVIPCRYGGCDEFGFNPVSTEPVTDLSEAARKELKRESILVLSVPGLQAQLGVDRTVEIKTAWREISDRYAADRTTDAEELLSELQDALGVVDRSEDRSDTSVEILTAGDGGLLALLLRSGKPGPDDISEEGNVSSSRTVPVLLDEHNRGVGIRARTLAKAVGLQADRCKDLACAGAGHDIGKADPRFQRLLREGDQSICPGKVLAKSPRKVRPTKNESTERHEAYSVALMTANPELLRPAKDKELALYLAGSHHGRGRSVMPNRTDDGAQFSVVVQGRKYEMDGAPGLGALGSGWPSLFWRLNETYGAWGLAYLESVLRLADYLQSDYEINHRARHE